MPDITFPPIDINKAAADFNHALREGAYVAVGLGVLGFQRAQVQRVELAKQLEAQWGQLSHLPATLNSQFEEYAVTARSQTEAARAQLTELAKALDERLQPARKQLDEQIDRWEQRLPASARNVVETVRTAATTPEQVLRTAVGLD